MVRWVAIICCAVLAGCVAKEPEPARPLTIECRLQTGEYRYFLNSSDDPSSLRDINNALRDWADVTNEKTGLPARDRHRGFSRNPLAFRAHCDVPWTHFVDVVEAAASHLYVSIRAELALPDGKVTGCKYAWPLDKSFGPPREGRLELRIKKPREAIVYDRQSPDVRRRSGALSAVEVPSA